jgi:Tol biopolymer transport system component
MRRITRRYPIGPVAALVALVAMVVPSPALAYTSTGTSYALVVVDNGAGAQQDPRISRGHVVYTDDQGGVSAHIEYFDFSTNAPTSIATQVNAIDFLADVSADAAVFTRVSSTGSAIYLYSFGTGFSIEVSPVAAPNRRNPAVGGATIVWEDVGVSATNDPELVVATDVFGVTPPFRLTNDAPADRNPNVSPDGATVVWEKCSATCDVYAAMGVLSSWLTTTPVATSAADEIWPDTNGSQIVYASNAGGAYHAYATTLGSTPVPLSVPGSVSENHPSIAGNFVAFESSSGTQTDIWVYDLATNTPRRITDTPASETLADIGVTMTAGGTTTVAVVWQVIEADANVYAAQFTVPSQEAVAGQFLQPLVQSTDPANPVLNIGKNGKVIPVKVQLSQGGAAITDLNAPGPVTIAVSKLASCSTSGGSDPVETYAAAGQSSAGTNEFRYDTLAQAWVYNLDTKALGLVTGNCYRIDVSVNGTAVTNAFAVFQPTK